MKVKYVGWIFLAASTVLASGCGLKKTQEFSPTPTPAVTAAPTVPPATPTPIASPTPVPKAIGTKTDTTVTIPVVNEIPNEITEIYMRVTGTEDWTDNLLNGTTLAANESAELYYTAAPEGSTGLFDIQLIGADQTIYNTVDLELSDMSSMTFYVDETNEAWVKYNSISQGTEVDYKETWVPSGY
ncbi:MAG: hypothetical protein Q4E89_12485 [Eubacteriales bacterium]|nr:hypothetical protein [Eubacteriales bacterium]